MRFRLRARTIATACGPDGKGVAFHIPKDSEVVVIDDVPSHWRNEPHRQVAVRWKEQTVSMFWADIQQRGERISVR